MPVLRTIIYYFFTFIYSFVCKFASLTDTFNNSGILLIPLLMSFSKLTRVGLHVFGWVLFFSMILVFTSMTPEGRSGVLRIHSPWFVLFGLFFIFIFYLNAELLIPKLYLQKNYAAYFVAALALLVFVHFFRPYDRLLHPEGAFDHMPEPPPFPNDISDLREPPPGPPHGRPFFDVLSLILFIMTWSLSTAVSIIKEWRNTEKRAVRAEADKAHAELSFLKAQINPHFLFNTLNNIYSLAVTKSDNTSFAIMKLSNIMRYVTDDVTHDFVPLQSEVDCMSDFIELQRLRTGKKVIIDYSVSGNLDGKKIAPLILMTFVENVFKYGTSNHEDSPVTIKLSAGEDKIEFFSENRLFQAQKRIERTGIGIKNTRQRLEYLYPKKHILAIDNANDHFSVRLILQLK